MPTTTEAPHTPPATCREGETAPKHLHYLQTDLLPQFHLNCRVQAPGFAKFSPVDLIESGYALKILLDMHFAYS